MSTTSELKALNRFAPSKKPRTRQEMIAYIGKHPAYGGHPALNVKLHSLTIPNEAAPVLDHLLFDDEGMEYRHLFGAIDDAFQAVQPKYQLAQEGRNGGYIVLYHNPGKGRVDASAVIPCKSKAEAEQADTDDLRFYTQLLLDFDHAVEDLVASCIYFALNNRIVEKTQTISRKVKVLEPKLRRLE